MSVRVSAPCRLHFGLFHVPVPGLTHWPDGRPVRKFGGVGLMVESPRVVVEVHETSEWSFKGELADRAMRFARMVHPHLLECDGDVVPEAYSITADGPTQHTGLGVGTALGLSVAAGMARLWPQKGFGWPDLQWLAEMCDRGLRSAVGAYGFWKGGLIVDAGKRPQDNLSRLESRLVFPEDWRVLLIRPTEVKLWHGNAEREAFGRGRSAEQALDTTARLEVLGRGSLIPAAQRGEFDTFAESVHEFNRVAGEPFAADQGGPYSSPAVTGVIDELLSWGVAGVGQSSWGPTVFAFARDEDEANHIAARARAWLPADTDVTVTAADNQGARIEVS